MFAIKAVQLTQALWFSGQVSWNPHLAQSANRKRKLSSLIHNSVSNNLLRQRLLTIVLIVINLKFWLESVNRLELSVFMWDYQWIKSCSTRNSLVRVSHRNDTNVENHHKISDTCTLTLWIFLVNYLLWARFEIILLIINLRTILEL